MKVEERADINNANFLWKLRKFLQWMGLKEVKFNVQPRSQVICRMLFLDILANLQKKKLRWSPSFSKITGFVQ